MVTASQIRAARALVDLKQVDLAKLADVSLRTMKRIEGGADAYERTLAAIQKALERRGVIFIAENGDGPGVRLKKRGRK